MSRSFTYSPLGDGLSVDLKFNGLEFKGIEISKEELPFFVSIVEEQDTNIVLLPGGSAEFSWKGTGYSIKIYEDALFFYKKEKIHRDDDRPAAVFADGCKEWFKEDKCHRETGPASIFNNGTERYFLDDVCLSKEKWEEKLGKKSFVGKINIDPPCSAEEIQKLEGKIPEETAEYYEQFEKDDPPTKNDAWGSKSWLNSQDKIHREKDRPAEIRKNGDLIWYKEGNFHRDNDKPAFVGNDGRKVYCFENQVHCLSGPAVVDGKYEEYWIYGTQHSKAKWEVERLKHLPKEPLQKEKSDFGFILGMMGITAGLGLIAGGNKIKKKSLPRMKKQEIVIEEKENGNSKRA